MWLPQADKAWHRLPGEHKGLELLTSFGVGVEVEDFRMLRRAFCPDFRSGNQLIPEAVYKKGRRGRSRSGSEIKEDV